MDNVLFTMYVQMKIIIIISLYYNEVNPFIPHIHTLGPPGDPTSYVTIY